MLSAGATSVCAALRAVTNWDAQERISSIDCPTSVIAGVTESDLPRQSELAHLLRGTFSVLDDTGHLAPLEAPGNVARAIEELVSRVGAP